MDRSSNGCWDYHNPVKIFFGPGLLAKLPALVAGRKALLVTTPGFSKRGISDRLRGLVGESLVEVLDTVEPNPDIWSIEGVSLSLLERSFDVIVALGGGSTLDTAKALSLMLRVRAPHLLSQHFERGEALPDVDPLPVIAIPTTAGTGSEVTPFATIWDKQIGRKYSLSMPKLYPQVALLDPELALTVPIDTTVATGLDVLSHAFEAIWNRNAMPITTAYALNAISLVLRTLPRASEALDNLDHRSTMMAASLLGGLAIAHTRTALAHSMSYPITARYGVPHGVACSFTLPAVLDFNATVDDGRLAGMAKMLGFTSIRSLGSALVRVFAALGVAQFFKERVNSVDDLLALAPHMLTPGRADNNLRLAEESEVRAILQHSWQATVFAENMSSVGDAFDGYDDGSTTTC